MLKSKPETNRERSENTNPDPDANASLDQAPAWFQNQMYAEAVANTQAMNQLRLAIVAKAIETILNPTPGSEVDPATMMALIDKLGEGMTPKT